MKGKDIKIFHTKDKQQEAVYIPQGSMVAEVVAKCPFISGVRTSWMIKDKESISRFQMWESILKSSGADIEKHAEILECIQRSA